MRIGVLLARLQPVHNGHLELISESILFNDETYVFIGSANKFNARNPLPISLRVRLLKEALEERFGWNSVTKTCNGNRKIFIVPLDDLTDESDNSHDWGFYLYSRIVTATHSPNFTIYYSDGFEIITTWFPGFILSSNVSLYLVARSSCESGVSATSIRKAIVEDDMEFLNKFAPKSVRDMKDTIKNHIELSKLIK